MGDRREQAFNDIFGRPAPPDKLAGPRPYNPRASVYSIPSHDRRASYYSPQQPQGHLQNYYRRQSHSPGNSIHHHPHHDLPPQLPPVDVHDQSHWFPPPLPPQQRQYPPPDPFHGFGEHAGYYDDPRSSDSDHTSIYVPEYSQRPLPPLAFTPQYHRPASIRSAQSSGRTLYHSASRKSTESVRVYPTQAKARHEDRSYSFSGQTERPIIPPSAPDTPQTQRRTPVVYPALLSRVAEAFKNRITLGERIKDGLSYPSAFDGREAVDKLAYIIKTTDRNLALLLGRALDAQKFFHDVTYDHRLRDSPNEIYQFRGRLGSFMGSEDTLLPEQRDFYHQYGVLPPPRPSSPTDTLLSDADSPLPSGVFTLLTDCYSPTCTRDRLCYSIACPRRLEQQSRLNMKPKPILKRTESAESLGDVREPGTLWIHSVPKEISDKLTDAEKKRQEAINEVISTERDFVNDLDYLRDFWMAPLKTAAGGITPESRRPDFVQQVFWNVLEIRAVNGALRDALSKRSKQMVVETIGDIFEEHVKHFAPFVAYGAHQLYGKYEFEKEKGANPLFVAFVNETERKPESRKLELNGYLTKPTTRLARYPLLLEAVLKSTPDDNPDKKTLPKVIGTIREFLTKVNIESGKSENRFNLAQLDQQLVFRNGEVVDLKLRDENRELIYKGPLKRKGGATSETAELQVFLFDHALLMVKQKASNKNEQYKVYRKPIPLELLIIASVDDPNTVRQTAARPKSLMSRNSASSKASTVSTISSTPVPTSKQGFAMTVIHLGRKGYTLTLWSPSWAGRKKWLEKIEERQNTLRDLSRVFDTNVLNEGYFVGTNRVTTACPFDDGRKMFIGTDNGVYVADFGWSDRAPVKVVSVINVTQVDVLEEAGLLIVLADKAVQCFIIDNLDANDAIGVAKRQRKISTNASFFKIGRCLNRPLVCIVKSGSVSSTIKTLEPIDHHGRNGKKSPAIRKFLQGGNDQLKVFKEFYIPTESSSVHFLKSKLCVGCTKGFEIVDLETLDTQGLLDPADQSLDFVQKRENVRPIAIYRVDGDFLLCYDEFAFYVNKNGWRARLGWIVHWEGHPTSFALRYPYILAFEPTFVEVRHVDSGALMQIIPGNNIRLLFAETPPSSSQAHHFQQSRQSSYGSYYPPNSTYRQQIILASETSIMELFEAPPLPNAVPV